MSYLGAKLLNFYDNSKLSNVKYSTFSKKNLELRNKCPIFAVSFLISSFTKSLVEVGSVLHQPHFFKKNLVVCQKMRTFAADNSKLFTFNNNKTPIETSFT